MCDTDFENIGQTGHVPLKEAIDLESVLKGQSFEINFNGIRNDEDEITGFEDDEIESFAKTTLDIDSDDDEETHSTPFEKLAKKMKNVTSDGKIKKLIKREGKGNTPPENAMVFILYSSYLEYSDEPVDVAYMKKPYQFRIGTAGLIGLNFAVETMKVNEKSYFLIGPEYAFGSLGHPPRVPPNATFFFQIELIRYLDTGLAAQFEAMTLEEKKKFPSAYKTALSLMENAKEHLKYNVRLAIRDYNRALDLIEECNLSNYEEQEEQQKLKLRLLTNLAICYNKDNAPKKTCSMCNEIFRMIKNTFLTVPAKVYFNNGRALFMIGELELAKRKLLQARSMEPYNTEISEELLKVQNALSKSKQKEKEFARLCLQNPEKVAPKMIPQTDDKVYAALRQSVIDLCTDLINSKNHQYPLPANGMTMKELEIIKTEVKNLGLAFRESKHNENNGELIYFITKM